MRKKITSKTLEKMLLDYSIRQRIASIDFGTYFPLRSRSANATNPFAQAKANPGLPVAFEILTEPPLSGSVVWETTTRLPIQPARLNSDDFWLEPESPLTTLGALGAASAPQDEDLSSSEPEFEESEDLASQPLDGEFRFSLDSQEFKVFDIQTTPPDGSRPSKERWYRDKMMGEDACQVGIFSVIKYVQKKIPSEYKPSFRKSLVEAITDEEFTALSRILRTRIKSRRIDLIRKGLASGDRVLDHTSLDTSLSGDNDGYSLASTIVGRELTPDQALLIKEEIEFKDERLRRAVEQLPDRQRRALALRHEPNTYEQCADEMGLTLDAFRSLLKRANDRLKEILIEEDKYKTGR